MFLKDNPLKIETISLKGYDDPEKLIQFIDEYLDYNASFDRELKNKLQSYYDAMSWGELSTSQNQVTKNFFNF